MEHNMCEFGILDVLLSFFAQDVFTLKMIMIPKNIVNYCNSIFAMVFRWNFLRMPLLSEEDAERSAIKQKNKQKESFQFA